MAFEALSSLGITTVTVIIGVFAYVYLHYKRRFTFWKDRGVPGPAPFFPVGTSHRIFTKVFHDMLIEDRKNYGKIYGTFEMSKPALLVAEPKLIRSILVKDSHIFTNRRDFGDIMDEVGSKFLFMMRGDAWRRVRNILSPTFTSGKMRKMMSCMNQSATEAIDALKYKIYNSKNVIDLKDFTGRYTLDVIAGCCFALHPRSQETDTNAFIEASQNVFKPKVWLFFLMLFSPAFFTRFIVRKVVPNKYMAYFVQACEHMVKQRKISGQKANDFLQLLVDANQGVLDDMKQEEADRATKDNEAHHVHEEGNDTQLFEKVLNNNDTKKASKKLEDLEVIGSAIQFIAAGYETTGTLLTFTFYELALNPDKQETLYQALKQAKELDYETISSNEYLDAVVSETLRMHPPLNMLDREASEEYTLPDTDISVPAGTNIVIPVYSIHYDPENYENPETFTPERFLPENRDHIKPYTYLPFGAGPRNCIGMRFALLEAKLLIVKLLLNFRFVPCEKTVFPPVYKKASGLLAYEPLFVAVESRQ